jgi:hypothetical protein
MSTVSVRKFAISVDPNEIVDFAEKLDYFDGIFTAIGFAKSGHYTYRYNDPECMIKAELQNSKDGYFLWMYVQAEDHHAYRLREIADAFSASVVERSKTEHWERKPGEGRFKGKQ